MSEASHQIYKQYFPYTDKCIVDSKPCKGKFCQAWLGEKSCWHRVFDGILESLFDEDASLNFIYFHDAEGNWVQGIRHLHIKMYYEKTFEIGIAIGFNSERLAAEVRKKFTMLRKWKIDPRCMDGGDDHDLVTKIDGHPSKKDDIIKYIVRVKKLMPKIIEFEKIINTCEMCKERAEFLTHYGPRMRSICYRCMLRIINENIEKYFQGFMK